jgi:hypothetical protein
VANDDSPFVRRGHGFRKSGRSRKLKGERALACMVERSAGSWTMCSVRVAGAKFVNR